MAHIKETELNLWAEGALSGSRRGAVEAHLCRCRRCREKARELTVLFDALGQLPSLALTRAVEARVAAIPGTGRSVGEERSFWQHLEAQWRSLAYGAVAAGVVTGCILGATVLDYVSPPMDAGGMIAAVEVEEGDAGYFFLEEGAEY
ncbi:MAG: zf-HC2 domain-containing protein [Desulfobacterium sp.]|nr:zf-HC2 domain-containing protein [Desulfobacterium sp.]